ncbi:MAG: OadG family protein [Woeseiaceae bacterium]|nr:OadG family protein [Woeseiaceae bacterium]
METSLLDQGVSLMFVGMGTVFVFLSVLVIGMSTMSGIAVKLSAEDADSGENEEEIAALTAAIAQHRKTTAKYRT